MKQANSRVEITNSMQPTVSSLTSDVTRRMIVMTRVTSPTVTTDSSMMVTTSVNLYLVRRVPAVCGYPRRMCVMDILTAETTVMRLIVTSPKCPVR